MPNTVMLAVHAKKGEQLDLKKPLLGFVSQTYGPQAGVGRREGAGQPPGRLRRRREPHRR